MTCNYTITIPAGSIDLTSPMDWFACQAAILEVMRIKDQGPVTSEADALTLAADSQKRAIAARRAGSSRSAGGKRNA
jgi:hypothetical protein